ncbi:cAMP-specific 3',5'-cyclic phosphodiesterase-like [Drosophila ficusphila]|uniref:cAMP-specific 3',5'-cyclic phosphodiesterase-like n=1 Tax=Drosophila ficusphila TaxID=30025 RepID=UPI001C8A1382|nr:cAMP-specific 3',5'-cyclic phosphodiesterase-like [Drosophila ficusphila]
MSHESTAGAAGVAGGAGGAGGAAPPPQYIVTTPSEVDPDEVRSMGDLDGLGSRSGTWCRASSSPAPAAPAPPRCPPAPSR